MAKKTLMLGSFPELPYSVREAFNQLRINMTFLSTDIKKILVISSVPNEGKSFIATHLWKLLAESGQKCVLVDSDLRKSVFKDRYGILSNEESYDLPYYLAGRCDLEDCIYNTSIENADIVPVFHMLDDPSLLLSSKIFEEMLNNLTRNYRYVIIDSPPLGSVADGEILASRSNGALLVIRSDMATKSMVHHSMQLLERAGCPLLGVVLNQVDVSKGGQYGKYGKYGKYGHYGKYGSYGNYGAYGDYGKHDSK